MSSSPANRATGLILGVTGCSHSGKVAVATHLAQEYGFAHVRLKRDPTETPNTDPYSDESMRRVKRLSTLVDQALLDFPHGVIVTGLRHKEEATWINEQAGTTIRVMLPQPSTEVINIDADRLLLNSGNDDELYEQARRLVDELLA